MSGFVAEILSSTDEDSFLMETVNLMEKGLSNQDFEVRRLLLNFEEKHKPLKLVYTRGGFRIYTKGVPIVAHANFLTHAAI